MYDRLQMMTMYTTKPSLSKRYVISLARHVLEYDITFHQKIQRVTCQYITRYST